EAMNNLGFLYYTGKGVERDYSRAVAFWKKAVALNNKHATSNLGVAYENGNGVNLNYAKAAEYYSRAEELGYNQASADLARLYTEGLGVTRDLGKALEHYFTAGSRDYEFNLDQAIIDEVVNEGDDVALFYLAKLYYYGYGVSEDQSKALKYYKIAAEKGSAKAMNNIGNMYYNGSSVTEESHTDGVSWFRKAAELGNPIAMRNIGLFYEENGWTTEDYDDAQEYYLKALKAGRSRTYRDLARLYEIYPNTELLKVLESAAQQQNRYAQYAMGYANLMGLRVPFDVNKAREWFERAAAQNHSDAKEILENWKLEEIMARHLKAMGGKENWNNVNSLAYGILYKGEKSSDLGTFTVSERDAFFYRFALKKGKKCKLRIQSFRNSIDDRKSGYIQIISDGYYYSKKSRNSDGWKMEKLDDDDIRDTDLRKLQYLTAKTGLLGLWDVEKNTSFSDHISITYAGREEAWGKEYILIRVNYIDSDFRYTSYADFFYLDPKTYMVKYLKSSDRMINKSTSLSYSWTDYIEYKNYSPGVRIPYKMADIDEYSGDDSFGKPYWREYMVNFEIPSRHFFEQNSKYPEHRHFTYIPEKYFKGEILNVVSR
ncbi:MAG: sel1 repeat family protein, partial [Balneolaceae bacterium]|nr:sel1 repeat family protein [Balneolaceae bacterium]